jgi:hypothetical protein
MMKVSLQIILQNSNIVLRVELGLDNWDIIIIKATNNQIQDHIPIFLEALPTKIKREMEQLIHTNHIII